MVPAKAKLPAKAPHVKVATGIGKTEVKTTGIAPNVLDHML